MKTKFHSTKKLIVTIGLLLMGTYLIAQQPKIQYFRPYDKTGVNVFETSKEDSVPFDGLKVRIGANFAQGWQNLSHSNNALATLANGTIIETAPGSRSFVNAAGVAVPNIAADPNVFGGFINTANNTLYTNSNQLFQLAGGFPLAQANFNIDVQLTDGVRVSLQSYMSSHHHNEFWVKGGYLQVDKVSFLKSDFFDNLWKNVTLKVGHMEINYGDQHFRRSDGGNTFWNPFMENHIMDQFTTEIGAELYWQKNGIISMIGMTDGEIQGNVGRPMDRAPSVYGKLGYDKTFGDRKRARLTGSFYNTPSSVSNTLFGGDRTGSNYQFVMDPLTATVTGNYTSGRFNPGYRDNVTAFMINPFVKFGGIEFFGTWEYANGASAVENGEIQFSNPTLPRFAPAGARHTHQIVAELLYRFGKTEQFYVGARYNEVSSTIALGTSATPTAISQGTRYPVTIDRLAFAGGWFISKNILVKAEYVTQNYKGYPTDNILSEGKFDGLTIQGSIAF
jgi:hypothetical protein